MSQPQALPANDASGLIEQETSQGILSNIGCPDIPIRQAVQSAYDTVVRLVGLEGSIEEEEDIPVLRNEDCEETQEDCGSCSKIRRGNCPKCPPPPFGEYTKSAIQAISNLLGLKPEPVQESEITVEDDGDDSKLVKADETSPATLQASASYTEESDSSKKQEEISIWDRKCRSQDKCPPPPFGEHTRSFAQAVGHYIGYSTKAGNSSKAEDEIDEEKSDIENKAVNGEKTNDNTKSESGEPPCQPKQASFNVGEEQTEQLSVVTRSAYKTVVRLIGAYEAPEKEVGEPELVNEEHEHKVASASKDEYPVCKTCRRYGKKKCAPPPLGEYTKSAIQAISNVRDYVGSIMFSEDAEDDSETSENAVEETVDDESTKDQKEDESACQTKSPDCSVNERVNKKPDILLRQSTRSAFQAVVQLVGLDSAPEEKPTLVSDSGEEVPSEAEVQDSTRSSCTRHEKKKCPPPPLSEYTKSAIQGISNLMGLQREDVEEKVSRHINAKEAIPGSGRSAASTEGKASEGEAPNSAPPEEKLSEPEIQDNTREDVEEKISKESNAEEAPPPSSGQSAVPTEGRASGEEVLAEPLKSQCRSKKCPSPPLGGYTRDIANAIGRYISNKDETGDISTPEGCGNAKDGKESALPKPTSYTIDKAMPQSSVKMGRATNAVFKMFGKVLGATRDGVYVPVEEERGNEEEQEIQESS
ncbi:unnamed protein product [Acanthoscelides obtectus]|uniref:Uncharacterized protein n=1 Tax=Acanthoscelides obtectus TaxID=200917 RepID=A0A9P0NZD4_ACAOB|nr:unnamed protein product [Acanthoscelides obtectus]CAK1663986.1 hypothetical protein AOBTE_LOCUS23984 [Acanthoscelides obtectus]